MKIDRDEVDIIPTRYPYLPYILSYYTLSGLSPEISAVPIVDNCGSSLCRTSCINIEPHFYLTLLFSMAIIIYANENRIQFEYGFSSAFESIVWYRYPNRYCFEHFLYH
jgi:hypothetical protein